MDGYLLVKTVHVLSATVLFGTGLGIAFFCFVGLRNAEDRMALFAARATCIADMLFTLTAAITPQIIRSLAGVVPPWLSAKFTRVG
jgi:uncharacterized membrane protein